MKTNTRLYKGKNSIQQYFSDYKLISRYIVSGGTGAFINLASIYVLTSIFELWYIVSAVLAFLLSLFVTFFLQKIWTFNDSLFYLQYVGRQAIFYTTSSIFFLALNMLMLYFFVEFFGLWYLFAQFLSLGVVASGSFLFNSVVTFRNN